MACKGSTGCFKNKQTLLRRILRGRSAVGATLAVARYTPYADCASLAQSLFASSRLA